MDLRVGQELNIKLLIKPQSRSLCGVRKEKLAKLNKFNTTSTSYSQEFTGNEKRKKKSRKSNNSLWERFLKGREPLINSSWQATENKNFGKVASQTHKEWWWCEWVSECKGEALLWFVGWTTEIRNIFWESRGKLNWTEWFASRSVLSICGMKNEYERVGTVPLPIWSKILADGSSLYWIE